MILEKVFRYIVIGSRICYNGLVIINDQIVHGNTKRNEAPKVLRYFRGFSFFLAKK